MCGGLRHGRLHGRSRSELGAVTWPFDDELVGAVSEAVESGVGEDGVGEETDPLTHVAVAGDDEGRAPVAFDDERVEVLGLLLREAMQAEVVEHEKVRG